MISYLYKFYSWYNRHSLENIIESKLFFSNPQESFKDENDCAILGFDGTKVFPNIRVACFSREPNDYMWGKYASNGNGVCLQYLIDDLREIGDINPVKYVDNNILQRMHNDFKNRLISNNNSKIFMTKYLREILITKDNSYVEENEYRIIVESKKIFYQGIKPAMIVFGNKTSVDIKEEVVSYCNKNRIHWIHHI